MPAPDGSGPEAGRVSAAAGYEAPRIAAKNRDGTPQISGRSEPEAGQIPAETGEEVPQAPARAPIEGRQLTAVNELLAWISNRFADIASMDEPLTDRQALWILHKYDLEDIQRLIAAMHNKGAANRNCNTFNAFLSFAQYDGIIREKKIQRKRVERLYTYDQFCDLTAPGGKYRVDDFEIHHVEGYPFRKLKPELCMQR